MESVQESRPMSDTPDNDVASLRLKVTQLEGQLKDEAESKQLQKEQVGAENNNRIPKFKFDIESN